MTPGRSEVVELLLDDAGYRFLPGHRIRLAVSTAYFPMVLPPPEHVVATVTLGAESFLELPTPSDLVDIDLPEPPEGVLPVYEQLPTGEVVHPTNGMIWRESHESTATISPRDPLGFECVERVEVMRRRAGIETLCVATGRLTATAQLWCVEAGLVAFENGVEVFNRSWSREIARDHQ